jgi:hypothetical protein
MTPNNPAPAKARNTASLLRERLRSPIPVERIAVESLQEALGRVTREMLPLAGIPVGELLLNPHTELAALVTLKNCAKKLAARLPHPDAEYNAMVTIYFAAIASARVFHRQNISAHSEADLRGFFRSMEQRPWMASELAGLFRKAAAAQALPGAGREMAPLRKRCLRSRRVDTLLLRQ